MLIRTKTKLLSRNSRGDTIVEVMLTMAVLAFVLGASYVTANRSLQRGVDSSIRTQAIASSQQQAEVLKVISISSPGRLTPYRVDNKPFCIDPSTTNFIDLGPSNPTCDGNNGVRLVNTYDTTTKTFTIKSQWPSQRSDTIINETSIKYKTPNSFRDNPGATAPVPTEGGPAAINSSGVTITANPDIILPGGRTNLSWTTIYGTATNCVAQTPSPNVGGWSGNKGSSGGPEQTAKLDQDTTFSLLCTRSVGGNQDTGSVIAKVESVTMYADSPSIPYGGSTTLHWDSKWTNNCTLGSGNLSTSGQQSTGSLYVDKIFTIACSGTAGTVSKDVTVQVSGAPRVLSFTSSSGSSAASPIAYGAKANLIWSSENTTGCNSPQFGWVATSGSYQTPALFSNSSYTIACYNGATVWTPSSATTVYVAPRPAASISASPNPIAYGAGTVVSWSSTNATGCVSPQLGGLGPSGSYNTPALYGSTSYSVTCSNSAGALSTTATVTVNVNPAPTATINASPSSICYGCGSTISWSSTNATSCTSGGTSGSYGTGALYSDRQYSVACFNSAGATSGYVYVTVSVSPAPPSYPPSSYPPSSYPPSSYPPSSYPPSSYPPSSYPPSSYPPPGGCGFNRNLLHLSYASIFKPKSYFGRVPYC